MCLYLSHLCCYNITSISFISLFYFTLLCWFLLFVPAQIDAVGEKKKPAPAPRKKKPTKEVPQPREENSTGNSFTINFGDAHESQDGGKSAEVKKTPRTSADTPGKSLPSSNSNSPVIALPRPPPGGGRRRGRPSGGFTVNHCCYAHVVFSTPCIHTHVHFFTSDIIII